MNEKDFWQEVAKICNDKALEDFKNIRWDKYWSMELVEKTHYDASFCILEKK